MTLGAFKNVNCKQKALGFLTQNCSNSKETLYEEAMLQMYCWYEEKYFQTVIIAGNVPC